MFPVLSLVVDGENWEYWFRFIHRQLFMRINCFRISRSLTHRTNLIMLNKENLCFFFFEIYNRLKVWWMRTKEKLKQLLTNIWWFMWVPRRRFMHFNCECIVVHSSYCESSYMWKIDYKVCKIPTHWSIVSWVDLIAWMDWVKLMRKCRNWINGRKPHRPHYISPWHHSVAVDSVD